MYINKNKGVSITETLITLLVLSILFEIFYIYIISINLEKKEILKKLEIKLNANSILRKVEESIYESKSYKIYDFVRIQNIISINYSKKSLESGNTLIIEKYSPLKENTDIEIYFQSKNKDYVESFYAEKDTKDIIWNIQKGDIILNNIKIDFSLAEYGVKVEGKYINDNYKYELKK
ncbi:MAG: hypothetical protein ACRCZR_03635 [Cetobacterium sp.]